MRDVFSIMLRSHQEQMFLPLRKIKKFNPIAVEKLSDIRRLEWGSQRAKSCKVINFVVKSCFITLFCTFAINILCLFRKFNHALMIKAALEKVINEDMSAIWSVLDGDQKRLVAENLEIHSFKKNQYIYLEGDEPENLWCLFKGKVKKIKEGVGGRVQILRLMRPVQYFGYRAHFADEKYVSSAMAIEPSEAGSLPFTVVDKLIRENNKVAQFFIQELARNLGGSDTRIVTLTQKHIRGRLAEALIVLLDHYGYEDDNSTLKIYMAREDLASLSNMTTSNAIRTLTTFVNEKIIVVDGRRIKIINEPMLRKISKLGF